MYDKDNITRYSETINKILNCYGKNLDVCSKNLQKLLKEELQSGDKDFFVWLTLFLDTLLMRTYASDLVPDIYERDEMSYIKAFVTDTIIAQYFGTILKDEQH